MLSHASLYSQVSRSSFARTLLVVGVALTACKANDEPSPAKKDESSAKAAALPAKTPEPAAPSEAAGVQSQEIVVFAASSLSDVFKAMAEPFSQAHPEIKVTFNFAGTQELRTQLEHGANADVFACADTKHMAELEKSSRVHHSKIFARNEPIVVVAKEKAQTITAFADLATTSPRLVVGATDVPIGRYTAQIFDRAAAKLGADFRQKVEASIVSRELNVRQVLAKVRLGEADVGIVYRTDAQAAGGEVTVLPIPEEFNVIAEYPIAVVADAAHRNEANAFVDFVHSQAGQALLKNAGFLTAM